ncbi:MAG: hypothetical protein RLN70_00605, partial [Rhodospirillaceae bacterium]
VFAATLFGFLVVENTARAGPAEDLAAAHEAYALGNFAAAAQKFQKAADQGNVTAQDSLGVMYANGEGISRDYLQAYMWFQIALSNVAPEDVHWRSRLARFMSQAAAHLTPAQVLEAERRANAWTSPR